MDSDVPSSIKGSKPQYIVRARQTPDSDFMITIGAAWEFKDGDGFVVRVDMLPTKWNGTMLLTPNKNSSREPDVEG